MKTLFILLLLFTPSAFAAELVCGASSGPANVQSLIATIDSTDTLRNIQLNAPGLSVYAGQTVRGQTITTYRHSFRGSQEFKLNGSIRIYLPTDLRSASMAQARWGGRWGLPGTANAYIVVPIQTDRGTVESVAQVRCTSTY